MLGQFFSWCLRHRNFYGRDNSVWQGSNCRPRVCTMHWPGFSLFTLLRAASKVLSLKDLFWSLLQENSSQVWPRTGIPANWLTRCDLLQDAGMSTDYRPAPGRGFLSTHLLTFEAIYHQCMGGGGQDFTLTDFSTPSVSTASYWSNDCRAVLQRT